MSYILDALQRAALERERAKGTVPGLQTRSIAATTTSHKEGVVVRHRWSLLGLLIMLVVAAVSIFLWRASPVRPPAAAAPAAAPPAAPPIAPAAIAPLPAPAVASAPVSPELRRVNSPNPLPAPALAAPIKPPPSALATAPSAAPLPAPAPALQPSAQSASASQTPKATLPFLKDLPDAVRTQIPPLSISGVVYSDNPAQRLLLLNGQILTQGSRVAEDLVLDEIHPRSSDFTFKGTRFKLSH